MFYRWRLMLTRPHQWLLWLQQQIFIKIDPPLLGMLMLMSLLGCICLYSASGAHWPVLWRQFLRLIIGFSLLLLVCQIPPRMLHAVAPKCYILSIGMLVAVLVMGYIGKGAQRWIDLGLFHLQPSEFVKLAMPMMLAWLMHHRRLPPDLSTVSQSLAWITLPFFLIGKQPDLGTAMVVAIVGLGVLVFAGLRPKIMLAGGTGMLMLCPLLWHHMHAYQKNRIFTFLNPERDPLGSGYHIIQSKIAVGSGGIWGKGWLHGTQSHLNFLPEHTTDFIFAVVAEEFGLMGCLLLLTLILSITARIFYISHHANSTFNRLLCSGLGVLFFLSCMINMGMVLGLLPIVGIPLPLISYGGSNLMTTMIGFGMIMSIHAHKRLIDS